MRLVSALLDYYGHFVRRSIIPFRRYGISLSFPSILLVFALILTVLIPGISLAEHFRAMSITVFPFVLPESGLYIPTIDASNYDGEIYYFDVDDGDDVEFYSDSLAAPNPHFLAAPNPHFIPLRYFFFSYFFFLFLFSFLFLFFFNFSVSVRKVIRTLNPSSRISLTLGYFQLSNFITISGNVISSSYFQLIDTIPTWLGRFRVNRHSSSSPSNNIDWSHLPPDLARELVNRMTTFKDYIAATGVSQVWRLARSSISRRPQLPLPALMLSAPLLTDMRTLFSLYDNNRHPLQLSEFRRKRIWGSQHGWVATLGTRYVNQLVHLMTGNRIDLPQIQGLAPREEWFCLVHKFNILKDPSDESTFLVITIFGPMNSLAFTRVRLGAALNRRGEAKWVVVANPENLKFKDVVHFNGQIYALCDNGKLVCFEPVAPFANMVQVIADHPQDVGAHLKIYLVESLGNLYGVFRNGFLIPSERRFETASFFVYKFNFNASAWEEVTHLEGQTFFVGDGNSFSWRFPTSIIPSRSDCIYFTDDHWVWQKFPRKAYGGHDVGLFNMEIRCILPLTFGMDKPHFYSRPIFVTRNDKL